MPTVSKRTALRPHPHVAYRATQSGGLLVDVHTGACFQINRVGAHIWTELTAGKTVEETAEAVRARYGVGSEVVVADVIALCEAVLAADLADIAAQDPAGNPP